MLHYRSVVKTKQSEKSGSGFVISRFGGSSELSFGIIGYASFMLVQKREFLDIFLIRGLINRNISSKWVKMIELIFGKGNMYFL